MEKQDYLPYHQSLVKFLEIIEFDSQESIGTKSAFICRFRIESAVLLSHMQIVKIPEKELNFTAVNLLSFYKEFMIRYEHLMDEATSFSKVNEKEVIGHCFMSAVNDLILRPSESPEIPELKTFNWFDIPDDQSDGIMGIRLAGQLLVNRGFSTNQIISLCGKAAWFMKNDSYIRSNAMRRVLKIECPNFFTEYGGLFIKAWIYPSELTESEFAIVKGN